MEPRVKLWLERNGRIVMSEYRLRLLALVAETGSLAEAAEQMGLSYRRAWGKIKELERNLDLPLVESAAGGVVHQTGGAAHAELAGAAGGVRNAAVQSVGRVATQVVPLGGCGLHEDEEAVADDRRDRMHARAAIAPDGGEIADAAVQPLP